jgi:hypothetical protein
MKISKRQFILITSLFLLLPLSVHWQLLVFGKYTHGVVLGQRIRRGNGVSMISMNSSYNIIGFEANGYYVKFLGAENVSYPVGKKVLICYRKRNPEDFLLVNFSGLFFSNKMIIPFVVFIFWIAFYLTIRQNKYSFFVKQKPHAPTHIHHPDNV